MARLWRSWPCFELSRNFRTPTAKCVDHDEGNDSDDDDDHDDADDDHNDDGNDNDESLLLPWPLDTALPMHPKPQVGEALLKDAFLRAPCKAPDPTPLPMLSQAC